MSDPIPAVHSDSAGANLPPRPTASDFLLFRLFSRRWIIATLLVIIGVAVMARLGIWQLDRLEQRRQFNTRVENALALPELILSGDNILKILTEPDLAVMEYRAVTVRGSYDHANQVVLRNQIKDNETGVHLLTPLLIEGSDLAVLVDRGWVPASASVDYQLADWSQYDATGVVEIRGMMRASRSKADYGSRSDIIPAPGEAPLRAWHFANVAGIQKQLTYELLPLYIQQGPGDIAAGLPYRALPELVISEGSHMGYALQWFGFAALFGVGYPFYVQKRERAPK